MPSWNIGHHNQNFTSSRSYLCHLCVFAYSGFQHVLCIWIICRVSERRQTLLTQPEHLGSAPVFGGSVWLICFFCVVFFFFFALFFVLVFVLCLVYLILPRCRRGRDPMLVGFTTTCAISTYQGRIQDFKLGGGGRT